MFLIAIVGVKLLLDTRIARYSDLSSSVLGLSSRPTKFRQYARIARDFDGFGVSLFFLRVSAAFACCSFVNIILFPK
jgi:hypothetical protein